MGSAQEDGQGILMDQARAAARAWVRSLPGHDRVMVLRADALTTPATAFEESRAMIDEGIRESQPGSSALGLEQALAFARRVQRLQARRAGEIVFIGAGRVHEPEAGLASLPPNLRVVAIAGARENVGLRRIGMRRLAASPDVWQILVAVRNYGTRTRSVDLALQFARSPAGSRRLTLPPNSEQQVEFAYRERAAGWLEARLQPAGGGPPDAFPGDDRAILEVSARATLKVVVYSHQPQALRALFGANPQVEAAFEPPESYDPAVKADLVVLDRFAPKVAPSSSSLWIEPPGEGSPVAVKATVKSARLTRWRSDSPLAEGLRTADASLESAQILSPAPGDAVVAETEGGAVIVARGSPHKSVFLGFHPGRGSIQYELAAPVLMANIVRWMAPGAFRLWEAQAGTVGTVTTAIDQGVDSASVQVLDQGYRALPFTLEGGALRFFAGSPGTVRVQMEDRELVYALNLPDVGESVWRTPAGVKRGVPRTTAQAALPADVWHWLALAGGLGLLVDWILFGRSRAIRMRGRQIALPLAWRKAS
jgi:hypothetical protein